MKIKFNIALQIYTLETLAGSYDEKHSYSPHFNDYHELNIATIKKIEWYRGEVLDGDWIVSKSMLSS